MDQRFRWKNKEIREHIAVLDGGIAPTILLKNAKFLHSFLRTWVVANIWIYHDRIVYIGEALPQNLENCEVIDCTGLTLVPGYIEPHVHPFQLYNPITFARYASLSGTTTLINDNMLLFLHLSDRNAFSFLHQLKQLPISQFWWCRYDSQTEMIGEELLFTNGRVKSWLEQHDVLQGGELTGWPKLLAGDDLILFWIQETKRQRKKVEGHFPGASEKTLVKMKLFGVDGDHEALDGKDVFNRLFHGYMVTLRHSSIRPDLPKLLKEIQEYEIHSYESFMMTTDGSTPVFYKDGVMDQLIRIAIEQNVPIIDAYHMASYNVARYFNMDHEFGAIATGRIANINFLTDPTNPTPVSVLAKGQWVKRDGEEVPYPVDVDWHKVGFSPLQLDWDLTEDDLQFSMTFGMEMVNEVITKPYTVSVDLSEELAETHDESFFLLLDRKGKWRLNTIVKGFANRVKGFASSYSCTGDIILIGKSKKDMKVAFNRMKEIGGGIILAENGEIIFEFPLPLSGFMSDQSMDKLMEKEKGLKEQLVSRGYPFQDPIYSLLFFSSTHLPYIRLTPKGMYDVINKKVLFPTLMR